MSCEAKQKLGQTLAAERLAGFNVFDPNCPSVVLSDYRRGPCFSLFHRAASTSGSGRLLLPSIPGSCNSLLIHYFLLALCLYVSFSSVISLIFMFVYVIINFVFHCLPFLLSYLSFFQSLHSYLYLFSFFLSPFFSVSFSPSLFIYFLISFAFCPCFPLCHHLFLPPISFLSFYLPVSVLLLIFSIFQFPVLISFVPPPLSIFLPTFVFSLFSLLFLSLSVSFFSLCSVSFSSFRCSYFLYFSPSFSFFTSLSLFLLSVSSSDLSSLFLYLSVFFPLFFSLFNLCLFSTSHSPTLCADPLAPNKRRTPYCTIMPHFLSSPLTRRYGRML